MVSWNCDWISYLEYWMPITIVLSCLIPGQFLQSYRNMQMKQIWRKSWITKKEKENSRSLAGVQNSLPLSRVGPVNSRAVVCNNCIVGRCEPRWNSNFQEKAPPLLSRASLSVTATAGGKRVDRTRAGMEPLTRVGEERGKQWVVPQTRDWIVEHEKQSNLLTILHGPNQLTR